MIKKAMAHIIIKIFIVFFLYYVGDEFALRDGGKLYCKEDNDIIEKTSLGIGPPSSIESNNNNNNTNLSNNNHSSELGSMSGKSQTKYSY